VLVLARLDRIAEVVAQLGGQWERDVYGQTIRGRGLLVFQFRGHAWTGILDRYFTDNDSDLDGFVTDIWNTESQAESLSQKLYTRTIYYWIDDSGGCIGYIY
jgi:hypothetical protein